MSDSLTEVVTASESAVVVEKSFEGDEFAVPAIKFVIRSERDERATLSLVDHIPEAFPMDNVGFHPDYENDNWTAYKDQRVQFERELDPGEQLVTVYGVRLGDDDEPSDFLGTPTIEEVAPVTVDSGSNGILKDPEPDADSDAETPEQDREVGGPEGNTITDIVSEDDSQLVRDVVAGEDDLGLDDGEADDTLGGDDDALTAGDDGVLAGSDDPLTEEADDRPTDESDPLAGSDDPLGGPTDDEGLGESSVDADESSADDSPSFLEPEEDDETEETVEEETVEEDTVEEYAVDADEQTADATEATEATEAFEEDDSGPAFGSDESDSEEYDSGVVESEGIDSGETETPDFDSDGTEDVLADEEPVAGNVDDQPGDAVGEDVDDRTGDVEGDVEHDESSPPSETAAETTTAEPEPSPPSVGSVAVALADEIRAGEVDDDDLRTIQRELDVEMPESTNVRVRHLQSRVEDLSAYTEALEEFIDENGDDDGILNDLEEDIERVRSDVDAVEDEVGSVRTDTDERLGELTEDVSTLKAELNDVGALRDELSDLEARLDDLADVAEEADGLGARLTELEELVGANTDDVTAVGNELGSLESELSQLRDELGDVSGVADEVESLSSALDGLEENLSARVESVEGEIADIHDELEDIQQWRGRISDVFGN